MGRKACGGLQPYRKEEGGDHNSAIGESPRPAHFCRLRGFFDSMEPQGGIPAALMLHRYVRMYLPAFLIGFTHVVVVLQILVEIEYAAKTGMDVAVVMIFALVAAGD